MALYFCLAVLLKECGTHQLVLVGGDSDEGSLWEDKGAELLGIQGLNAWRAGGALPAPHNVQPRLILVHRVEDYLLKKEMSAMYSNHCQYTSFKEIHIDDNMNKLEQNPGYFRVDLSGYCFGTLS